MYSRVVIVEFQRGKIDKANRIVNEFIVPVLRELKGFKSAFDSCPYLFKINKNQRQIGPP